MSHSSQRGLERALLFISFFRLSSVDKEIKSTTAFGFKITMDMFILGNVVPLLKRNRAKEKNNLKAIKLHGI